MPATSGHGLRYPQLSDPVNVPQDIQNLADDVDAALSTGSSSAANVITVDTTTDVQGAIATALATLTGASGRPSGTLRVGPKTARLGTPLDLNLGKLNTPPGGSNWGTDTRERLTLDLRNLYFDAGTRNNISIHAGFGVELHVGINGGGARGTVTDGAITTGTAVLTSAALAAAGVTVGDVIEVAGAGPQLGVGNLPLMTTVRSVAGNNFTLSDTAEATVSGAAVVWMTAGLRLYDLVGATGHVYGKNYAGALWVADATGSNPNSSSEPNPRHLRSFSMTGIIGISCGRTIFQKRIEAFGTLGDIFSTPVYSDYVGNGADTHWSKYEGGIGADVGATLATNYLWLDRCNNFQLGEISVGDRALGACVRISSGNVGTIHKIRATGFDATLHPAKGIELLDVDSIGIDRIQTAWCPIGVHVVGGGQNGSGSAQAASNLHLGQHLSLTSDTVALQISPSDTQTAPNVEIDSRYRYGFGRAVVVEAGLTGGRLLIGGKIDTFNRDNLAQPQAQCLSAAYNVDLKAGFLIKQRTGASTGGWVHTDPTKLRGRHVVIDENNLPAKGSVWTPDGSGGQQLATSGAGYLQNDGAGNVSWGALSGISGAEQFGLAGLVWTTDPRGAIAQAAYAGSRMYGVRVVIPKTGTLADLIFLPGTLSGNYDLGVLGSTLSGGARPRLWSAGTGSAGVAMSGLTAGAWAIHHPNIAVTAGDVLDFVLGLDNVTAQVARAASVTQPALPSGWLNGGGSAPKMTWVWTGGFFIPTAGVVDTNTTGGTITPLILGRVA